MESRHIVLEHFYSGMKSLGSEDRISRDTLFFEAEQLFPGLCGLLLRSSELKVLG
jgi:hypothetical protein